jgi:hypothetical protein
MKIEPRIVYSRHYNIRLFGLERLHPFDSRKHGSAFKVLRRQFGRTLRRATLSPIRPVSPARCFQRHTALDSKPGRSAAVWRDMFRRFVTPCTHGPTIG